YAPLLDLIRRGQEDASAPNTAQAAPEATAAAQSSATAPAAAASAPLRDLFERMIRVARTVARREEKEIDVRIEADASVLEQAVPARLADPLLHLASNAVAHGAALPAERQ